jgi:hypothetical protein
MKLYNSVDIFLSWPAFVTSAIGNLKRLQELNAVSNLGNLYIYHWFWSGAAGAKAASTNMYTFRKIVNTYLLMCINMYMNINMNMNKYKNIPSLWYSHRINITQQLHVLGNIENKSIAVGWFKGEGMLSEWVIKENVSPSSTPVGEIGSVYSSPVYRSYRSLRHLH